MNTATKKLKGYVYAFAGVAVATIVLLPFRELINGATVSLFYMLVVLGVATVFGSRTAFFASFIATLCLNFFYLPPYYTFTISDPENWIALIVFLTVSLTVGHLSATARRRAKEAELLNLELQEAFEKASETEAIKRSEKLKSALLDAVTHDLRTPLTSIKAATTMLIDDYGKDSLHATLEAEGRVDLLQVINEETDRLNSFVESMVELARLEAGDVDWQRSSSSLGEIVSIALQRSAGAIAGRNVDVRIPEDLPMLRVDARAIAEVIYNLVDNAAKYSPKGTPVIITAESSGDKVMVAIEDQGKGIPESEWENVFRKFYRGDTSTKGFGIGLAIVRAIVEAHRGTIHVEPGEIGSRFVFELPVDTDE